MSDFANRYMSFLFSGGLETREMNTVAQRIDSFQDHGLISRIYHCCTRNI